MQSKSESFIKIKIELCLISLSSAPGGFAGEHISLLGSVEMGRVLFLVKIQINSSVRPAHIANVKSELGWNPFLVLL